MSLKDTDNFYASKEEPIKGCLLALRHVVLNFSEAITETTKYGMPCFCYGKRIICYLWTEKKTGHPYLPIADGNLIDHPLLEQGERSRMKILRVNAEEDLPVVLIIEILTLAISIAEEKS